MPSDKAVVFLQNHDTQHQCGLSYRDGNVFRIANVWMLAQPYGFPSVLSSYAFACPVGNSMGPPSDAGGHTNDVTCASSLETAVIGQWVCEHRDPSIRTMVAFRRLVAGTRRQSLVGQRRQRDRLLARRQGLRRHQRRADSSDGLSDDRASHPACTATSSPAGGARRVASELGWWWTPRERCNFSSTRLPRSRSTSRRAYENTHMTRSACARCPHRAGRMRRPAPDSRGSHRGERRAIDDERAGVDSRRYLLRGLRSVVLRQRRRRRRRPQGIDPETRLHQRRQPRVVAEPRRVVHLAHAGGRIAQLPRL